jgi:hypothetical protein
VLAHPLQLLAQPGLRRRLLWVLTELQVDLNRNVTV